MAIKRGSKVEVGFSAASMTDLIFLLLLFFVIASTQISPNALKLTLPQSSNQVTERVYTTVSITGDLRYYVELEPVALADLEGILRRKLHNMEDPTISLHCEKSVPIDEVVKVMNIARNNKYRLILATQAE